MVEKILLVLGGTWLARVGPGSPGCDLARQGGTSALMGRTRLARVGPGSQGKGGNSNISNTSVKIGLI